MPDELARELPAIPPRPYRVAIVIPWFGRDLKGGAELHAWQLATRLASRRHDVEVLTTCCRAHGEDWATNHLPAGLTGEADAEGFRVRRFPVEPRDATRFDVANARLLAVDRATLRPGVPPVSEVDEAIFCRELIRSPSLLSYLEEHREDYDAIILLPYLYGPVLDGVRAAADRSLLQPCLHDEAYAYLPAIARAFYGARRLLFLSEGERRLAMRLFGPGIAGKSILSGAGVDVVTDKTDDSLLQHLGDSRFVLCLGRKDPGKNTDFLAWCFQRYRREHPEGRLKLVIAGPGQVELPQDCPGLVEFGMVSEAQKRSLLRHCAALFHPSENESYSRVIMEAWMEGRPAAAHENCLATATAVSEGGGWMAATEEQWSGLFHAIERATDEELAAEGERGRRYAAEVASWDAVIGRYENAIAGIRMESLAASRRVAIAGSAVHQVLPNVAVGDAITNHALWIRDALRKLGHPSEIFAIGIDQRLSQDVRPFSETCLAPHEAVIYHHSIGSALTPAMAARKGAKCLLYHNITPHRYLEPYLPLHARLCREGREDLPNLAARFPLSAGDSIYNAIELSEVGFRNPGVLPLCVSPAKWERVPDAALMARLQDGRTNVLFVGRLSPNKRQEDLILAFSHLRELDASARLLLVGTSVTTDCLYLRCLKLLCGELGVEDAVEFSGHVTDEELAAYYRTAHLFWSMSEHEGFCVPLVEAMWFDVPVFAYASSAVPETMGEAGCLFSSKQDPGELARQALRLARDPATRQRILQGQRERRTAFLEGPVTRRLEALVSKMLAEEPAAAVEHAPEIDPADVRRIAVVKLDHIGDVLLASPAFESLKRRFPCAAITAVVAPHSAEILRNNPHVDEIVAFDAPWFWRDIPSRGMVSEALAANARSIKALSAQRFDLVVNLRADLANLLWAASIPHTHLLGYANDTAYPFLITHPLTRTRGMHICQQHRELLAVVGADTWSEPALYPSASDRQVVATVGSPKPGTVAVFAGAGIPLKCWSPAKFRELVRRLRLAGIPVVIVGSASDRETAGAIVESNGAVNLCGRFNLLQLAAYLEECAVLVTNDSAPMHIAAAAGTATVYITRPNTAEEFAPVGPWHLRCCAAGCAAPCGGFDAEKRGELSEFCRCIQGITVDEVEAKVWDALGAARIRRAARLDDVAASK